MKRIIEFQVLDDKYSYTENGLEIFEVNKKECQLDVKKFYNAFFSNGKYSSEIELDTTQEINKDDQRVFDAISKLINDIHTRLKKELENSADELNCDESLDSYRMPDHS